MAPISSDKTDIVMTMIPRIAGSLYIKYRELELVSVLGNRWMEDKNTFLEKTTIKIKEDKNENENRIKQIKIKKKPLLFWISSRES